MSRKKKIYLSSILLFIPISFCLDYYSSIYGEGMIFKERTLKYDLVLVNTFQISIAEEKDAQEYEGQHYIFVGAEYKLSSGEIIKVKILKGYRVHQDYLDVLVIDWNDRLIKMRFWSKEDFHNNSPELIFDSIESEDIILSPLPNLVYFWIYFRLFLMLLYFGLVLYGLYKFFALIVSTYESSRR